MPENEDKQVGEWLKRRRPKQLDAGHEKVSDYLLH